ncbi:hypothetical protein [Novipirellula sp.]|uniref:hypothetical protein n=1 Tax=Novipirellula sp. TaxID=2795430 RepID=UPI003566C518
MSVDNSMHQWQATGEGNLARVLPHRIWIVAADENAIVCGNANDSDVIIRPQVRYLSLIFQGWM